MSRFTHCIVHAGTHKTGTTALQNVLAAHRAGLAAAGFDYPALERGKRSHNTLAHTLAVCADVDLTALRDVVTSGSRRRLRSAGGATLVLSAEEFSTRICNADRWAAFDDGAYWERRRHYLKRLRAVLPQAASLRTHICFRDHESYAHALYATKILSGQIDWSFADFVRRCAPIFDYRRQVELLSEVLGPVRIESYARLRVDLANRSFAWLGVPIPAGPAPRLRPTPKLDLIHWLARSVRSSSGPQERSRRADFCRDYRADPQAPGLPVPSLWASSEQRDEFLRHCHAPPLEDWPLPAASGRIVDADALEARADQIEAEYRRWRGHNGGQAKPWAHLWHLAHRQRRSPPQ